MDTLKPLKLFFRIVPDKLHGQLFCNACSRLMRGQTVVKKLGKLDGKIIQLTMTDTGSSWCFQFFNNRLKFVKSPCSIVDVHIKGTLKNFILLATHNEDPDTLFFNQELSLEGNTEDGLYLRNVLDAMEFDMPIHLKTVFGSSVASVMTPMVERFQLSSRLQALGKSFI